MSRNATSMPRSLRRRAAAMQIGPTRRGKGVKIMAIVDRHGLPLAVTTHAANHHEVTLVQLTFDFYMIEAMPENLIGDKAYDSDQLDERLWAQGTEMISPHEANAQAQKTQDGRRLRRYERRWIVERFFAGFSGNDGSWFAGNTTRTISSASCSLQPYVFCSSNFEIGSSAAAPGQLMPASGSGPETDPVH